MEWMKQVYNLDENVCISHDNALRKNMISTKGKIVD